MIMVKKLICIVLASLCFLSCGRGVIIDMGNEEEIASEIIGEIVESVRNADAETFINLCSEQTREIIPNLDEEFNQLIECFDGNIESYEKIAVVTHELIEFGNITQELEIIFEVKTSTDAFTCLAFDIIKAPNDSKRIGLYRIRVYSKEPKEELLSVGEEKLPIGSYDASKYVTSNE